MTARTRQSCTLYGKLQWASSSSQKARYKAVDVSKIGQALPKAAQDLFNETNSLIARKERKKAKALKELADLQGQGIRNLQPFRRLARRTDHSPIYNDKRDSKEIQRFVRRRQLDNQSRRIAFANHRILEKEASRSKKQGGRGLKPYLS